jgi:uncharacterized protein RhaS with RHS repeats
MVADTFLCQTKASVILFLGIVLAFNGTDSVSAVHETDRGQQGLKGSVKTMIEKDSLLVTTYHYDRQGKLTEEVREPADKVRFPIATRRYIYEHDDAGRRTRTTSYTESGSISGREAYEYDKAGNLLARVATTDAGVLEFAFFLRR